MASAAMNAKSNASPWVASLYGGVITAVLAVLFVFLFGTETPVLYIIGLLLIGIGPALGYQFAKGQLGSDWKSLIGSFIGAIPILGIILWPILVGAMTRGQSIGKLLLGNIISIALGIGAFLLLLTMAGQDPTLFPLWVTLGFSVWGGSAAAFMTAWESA